MYYVRTCKNQRYYYKRGKEIGFQDGVKGAKTFRNWETANKLCIDIQTKKGIKCEYIDEFELKKEKYDAPST